MAAQARLSATDSVGSGESNDSNALAVATLCLLHDLIGAAAFLAAHPLHAAYLLFFARHLAALAAFFGPLLVSTALLLAALASVGGAAEWHGVRSSLCGIAVAALHAELGPDGAGGAGLVAQLCSFVLGPGDAAAVDRVGEIVGELCDITASCFVSEEDGESLLRFSGEECQKELAFALPLMDDAVAGSCFFLDHEDSCQSKDEIDDKAVISEDLRGSECLLAQESCQREPGFVQEMEAEEEQEVVIQGGAIAEKRLECDPVSVEVKKCELVQAMELEVKTCEPAQELEKKKCEAVEATEVKELRQVEPKGIESCNLLKQRSSIAQRIQLWEAQVSGNLKTVIEDKEDISVKFSLETESIKDVKKCVDPCVETCDLKLKAQDITSMKQFEEQEFKDVKKCVDPCVETCDLKLKAQDITSMKQFEEQECSQEFKDVKECVPSETETFTEICTTDLSAEENAPASHTQLVPRVVQPEEVLQEQESRRALAEQDMQECQIAQPEQDLQVTEDYKDVAESAVGCNERESPLMSNSIASRVHSRTSSDNLISEGSPSQKEKEWKRTLACKLYEERMQLKLCRDRAVVEGSDNMDMLWEAYETGGSSGRRSGVKQGVIKVKSSKKVQELAEEGEEEESEEQDDDDDEGSVKQLCCLQALKFSTKKMNFGGGKPSLAKISRVLKKMTALSRVGSRRSQKG